MKACAVALDLRGGFPVMMRSRRLSHWSTLKTVYSRIIGIRRVDVLIRSDAP